MLCLMRYKNWTFRQAESRWPSSRPARSFAFALWPEDTTLYRFCAARRGPAVARGLGETVRRLRRARPRCAFPVPSMAQEYSTRGPHVLSLAVASTNGGKKCFRNYLQWLIVVDGKQQILLAQPRGKDPWSTRGPCPG